MSQSAENTNKSRGYLGGKLAEYITCKRRWRTPRGAEDVCLPLYPRRPELDLGTIVDGTKGWAPKIQLFCINFSLSYPLLQSMKLLS